MDQWVEEFLKNGTLFSKDKNHLIIAFGKRKWSVESSKNSSLNFYFPDFFLKVGMPWFTHEHWIEISIEEFKKCLSDEKLDKIEWQSADFSCFQLKFQELQESFKEGKLKKAVPYVFEKSNEKMTLLRLKKTVLKAIEFAEKTGHYIYGLWNSREGFLGVTPELLFQKKSKESTIQTMSLAGTVTKDNENELESIKLKEEHDLVTQGIIESLEGVSSFKISDKQMISFGDLLHSATRIDFSLNRPFDFKELVNLLHPTPALGAYPKQAGMKFLEQYEMKVPRGRFGAPIGFTLDENAFCVIGIRNIQWDEKGMKIGAGCGVTDKSVLEDEVKELELKIQGIKELFEL